MRRPASVLGACLTVLLSLAAPSAHGAVAGPARPVKAEKAKAMLGVVRKGAPLAILDVRTAWEYAHGRLNGAVNLDAGRQDFSSELAKLSRNAPYLVYDDGGTRAAAAGKLMRKLGFREVYLLKGGFPAWKAKGYPVDR